MTRNVLWARESSTNSRVHICSVPKGISGYVRQSLLDAGFGFSKAVVIAEGPLSSRLGSGVGGNFISSSVLPWYRVFDLRGSRRCFNRESFRSEVDTVPFVRCLQT